MDIKTVKLWIKNNLWGFVLLFLLVISYFFAIPSDSPIKNDVIVNQVDR